MPSVPHLDIALDMYWMYKFRNASDNSSITAAKRTPLQTEFTSYLNLASSLPNLIFVVLNTAISHRISVKKRIIWSLLFLQVFMIITLLFVNIDTDEWQQLFFGLTLVCVILLAVCSAVFSGSIFGLVGKFSPIYITAVTGGQALGGIFAAIAQIAALSIGASSTHTALVYFIIGNLTITLSIVSYVILEKMVFFKYYTSNPDIQVEMNDLMSSQEISYKIILRKMWCYGLVVFLTFLFTLAVYPGITVLVESEGKGRGSKWNDVYFVPTVAYLLFSVGDYLGRIIAGRIMKPRNITILVIISIARFIFIPLILLCNVQPRRYTAVVFDQDYQYILILLLFALSNGYLTNISTIFVTKVVEDHEKEIASSAITIFLVLGLTVGSALSLVIVRLI
ncbi:unnamed protein product [Acanthoscelides obtectus]|uniref:Equilibrative nucleoside transporter 3 n=1 Tax=Acanthoscelides obtectus TaxID=200917 RepID=A0A9P0NW88_ACAOB|nr:unnamed protein product [Acanthoscelides obtectus]CAK1672976.1 Equilibrative nucleoside transporter 3 [Acanthoscelides obtectus]